MSEKHKGIAEALVAFQAEMPTVRKSSTAEVPTKSGGKYTYDYADLTDITAAVMPVLSRHGLSFTACPTMTEGGFVLAYRLRHEMGEEDAGEYPLPDPAHSPAQTIGSAITYARRYALCAAVGLAPGGDDDDGQKAQDVRATSRPKRSPARSRDRSVQADPRADGWLAVKAKLDGVTSRDGFRELAATFPENLPGRDIPGDPNGRKVGDYMSHVWSQLPDVDEKTGEVTDEPVTEWPTAEIPDGEPVEAVIDDDDAPF